MPSALRFATIRGMEATSPTVDLADRRTTDLDVVLLWGQRSGRLWVEVTHRHSGRSARIRVTVRNALDVFHHPFAYAATTPCYS
jgi:hypothetical protein